MRTVQQTSLFFLKEIILKLELEKEFLTEINTDIQTHKKKRKKTINSKKKGNNAENECRKLFDERFTFTNFHRSPSSGAFVGGSNFFRKEQLNKSQNLVFVGDIYCARDDFKYTIEHKAYKEASFWDLFNESSDLNSFLEQAEHDAESVDKKPMLIIKYNNKQRIVYIKEKPKNIESVFVYKGWNCFLLTDLFQAKDTFFFSQMIALD